MLRQQVQQGKFGAGEVQRLAVEAGFLATRIELQAVYIQRWCAGIDILLLFAPVGTAQNCADTCHQFAIVKGFWQVVIGAQFQAQYAVKFTAAGGQHDDRRLVVLTQLFQRIDTVFLRHHDIEQ
ncbi:hypothetical protein D3C72_1532650 [compost metagenome]